MSKITAYRLSRLLGEWSAGQSARAERLGDALSQLIGENTLPLGSYLPAERALANALGISRGTVTAAYAHVRDAGLIDSRQGSGHRIISPARMLRFAHRPDVKVRAEVGDADRLGHKDAGALHDRGLLPTSEGRREDQQREPRGRHALLLACAVGLTARSTPLRLRFMSPPVRCGETPC